MDGVFYTYGPEFNGLVSDAIARAALKLGAKLSFEEAATLAKESYAKHHHSCRSFIQDHGLDEHDLYQTYHQELDVTSIRPDVKMLDDFRHSSKPYRDHQVLLTQSVINWKDRVLAHLDIASCFKAAICSDEYGYREKNRDSEPYLMALDALNAGPAQTDFIDDTVANLQVAKALGMRTFYIHHGKPLTLLPPGVDAQIAHPAIAYAYT